MLDSLVARSTAVSRNHSIMPSVSAWCFFLNELLENYISAIG